MSLKIYNEDFYQLFNEIADLMAILGENSFKIRAYREAARQLRTDIHPITKKTASESEFKKFPGIGEAIAQKMMQYIQTDKIDFLEELRKRVPKTVRKLLEIPHLGPLRVRDLYIKLGIKNKNDLIKAAENGEISKLPGFGEKMVAGILEGLKKGQEKKKRHERVAVEPIAKKLLVILQKLPTVKAAEIAGSFRRQSPTVGDLDILVTGSLDKTELETAIRKEFSDILMLGGGDTKISFVIFPYNLQVDIRFLPEESYGAALLYFTGSKEFNVMMRKKAIEKGYLLNEYGLFKDGDYFKGKTEKDVFEALGMNYTEPEKRK